MIINANTELDFRTIAKFPTLIFVGVAFPVHRDLHNYTALVLIFTTNPWS